MAYEMQFAPVLSYGPMLVEGTLTTLAISAQAIALGVVLGCAGALARTEGPRWLNIAVATYVEVFRNTPLLVQLLLVFFGLPILNIQVSADVAAVLGVGLNLGAYSTEIIRAGLQAIPKTQTEAGLALGMSRFQVIRYVVAIPALQIVYPALTSQLTLTLLGTSIASAISATELSSAGSIIESQTFRSLETYLLVAVIYIAMTLLFRVLYWVIARILFRRRARFENKIVENPIEMGSAA